MAIDPDTQAVLDMIRLAGRPPFETLTPDEARQAYAASRKMLQPPPEDVAESRDTTVPARSVRSAFGCIAQLEPPPRTSCRH